MKPTRSRRLLRRSRFYCAYCDVFVPPSQSARASHERGTTHMNNFEAYYMQWKTEDPENYACYTIENPKMSQLEPFYRVQDVAEENNEEVDNIRDTDEHLPEGRAEGRRIGKGPRGERTVEQSDGPFASISDDCSGASSVSCKDPKMHSGSQHSTQPTTSTSLASPMQPTIVAPGIRVGGRIGDNAHGSGAHQPAGIFVPHPLQQSSSLVLPEDRRAVLHKVQTKLPSVKVGGVVVQPLRLQFPTTVTVGGKGSDQGSAVEDKSTVPPTTANDDKKCAR